MINLNLQGSLTVSVHPAPMKIRFDPNPNGYQNRSDVRPLGCQIHLDRAYIAIRSKSAKAEQTARAIFGGALEAALRRFDALAKLCIGGQLGQIQNIARQQRRARAG